jgi:flagellar motor switch protein FliG
MSPSDLRKAAVLLTCLPDEEAGRLTARLTAAQRELVSAAIEQVGAPTDDEVARVIDELITTCPSSPLAEKPFGFLHDFDSQNLLTALGDEQPQTIALVVSNLSPARAAEIVGGLAPQMQSDVARRVATMQPLDPEVVDEVAAGLHDRLSNVIHRFDGADCGSHALASGKALNPASRSRSTKLSGPCVQ